MKLPKPFTIYDLRFAIGEKSQENVVACRRATAAFNRQSQILNRKSAMALVITLIMLSVTLIMAIAFLAVSRRERVSVTASTDVTTARLATDNALAAAQAQIIAHILSSTNALYNFNLLVSTNYINSYGFTPNSASPTNVNYDYRSDNAAFTIDDRNQNIANLLFLPRAPVMISPAEPTGRFFLNLNRNADFNGNAVFEDTGSAVPAVDSAGVTNGTIDEIGDPQWIGVLERPGQPHGPDNPFLARYCFIALPVGNSLDINHIHNQVFNQGLGAADGFFRNQGVGSWEINLAAFLADLNTNQWLPTFPPNNIYYGYYQPISYFNPSSAANSGHAFEDARALLAWRYNYFYGNLAVAGNVLNLSFPPNIFGNDNIDGYSDGPLQFTTTNIDENLSAAADSDKHTDTIPWAGADNPNRFFTPSDFFDPSKSSGGALGGFTNRLMNAGTTVAANGAHPTYDRYTFYRMLDQLGTDSDPDEGKMNLNYDNLDPFIHVVSGVTVTNPPASTNLLAWTPLVFFTNAADRMLRVYTTNWFRNSPSNYLATYYGLTGNAGYYFYVDSFGNTIAYDPTGFGLTNIPFFGMTNQVPAFGITNIPVQINGKFVYSPAVNRVLQLAANIYDASTNTSIALGRDYPSVFRPNFFKDNTLAGNIFIDGYEYIASVSTPANGNTPPLDIPVDISVISSLLPGFYSSAPNLGERNVYGVPWIIGAKKYLPNFNQFTMRSDVQVTRKLQVSRKKIEAYSAGSPDTRGDFRTNQMFVMSITNHVGFSLWNSYTSNYVGSLNIVVRDTMNMVLSNGVNNGMSVSPNWPNPTPNVFPFIPPTFTTWEGSAWDLTASPDSRQAAPGSFIYGTFNFPFLPESVYQNGFVPVSLNPTFDTNTFSLPVFPQFQLMTTNRLQAFILDGNKIIDYVQFAGPSGARDLNAEIKDPDVLSPGIRMWSTNAYGVGNTGVTPTWGVIDQIYVSQNNPSGTFANSWKAPPQMPPGLGNSPQAEADFFKAFFAGINSFTNSGKVYPSTNLIVQVPYTPTRTTYIYTIWQANDPLVHYLASDLNEANADTGLHHSDDPIDQPPPNFTEKLAVVGDRYQPWGRNEQLQGTLNVLHDDDSKYNLAFKDSLAWSSDNWDFPRNKYPSAGWLGRVHRGTPWQTVYLKSTNIINYVDAGQPNPNVGYVTWTNWLGDADGFDAVNSSPVQDNRLFDIFTTALNDNATRGTLSVNQTHLAAWSAVLSGINVISNTTPDVPYFDQPNYQTNIVIDPAGIDATTNSPVWNIVNGPSGINATRNDTNLFPLQAFSRVGDILRVPVLTEQSPFINRGDSSRLNFDISDEIYEQIPQQMLGLLRVGSPRYVIYCYGQTLRPAPDGTVLGGSFFGMVTNYQVVAESAARAVLSVHPVLTNTVTGPMTNYTTTIESFNVLPPE